MSANVYDSNQKKLIQIAGNSAGANSIGELDDVNISSPTDGQILQYDAATNKWVNAGDILSRITSLENAVRELQS